jgi:hypothetical protein
MGDGGTYHNDSAGYFPDQRQYFADERDVCRSNLIEIQIEDHNYEQKNGIHSAVFLVLAELFFRFEFGVLVSAFVSGSV